MWKQGRSSQKMIVQPCSRVLVPLQGMPIMISLSFFVGNEAATQVEDGNFRLSTRFLEHHPDTLLGRKHIHCSPLQKPIKTFPPKPSESSGFWAWVTHLLTWPCNNPFSAPNSNILSYLCIRSMNLGSVPMAWASNNFVPKFLFSSPSRHPSRREKRDRNLTWRDNGWKLV